MPRETKEKAVRRRAKKSNGKDKKYKNNINQNNVNETNQNDKFSFDDEIVIGLRRIDEPEINPKELKKQKKNANKRSANKKNTRKENSSKNNTKEKAKHIEEPELIIKSKYMQNYEESLEQERVHNRNLQGTRKGDKSRNNKTNKRGKLNNKKYIEEQQRNNYRKNNNKNPKQNYIKNKNIYGDGRNNLEYDIEEEIEEDPRLIKKRELSKKRRKFIFKIIKILVLIGIIIGGIIFALLSPIFNIKDITVSGNSKISSETIISLSGLKLEQNIFNFRTSQIVDGIKQNAYIDTVEVSRSFPDEVEINVTEREATFMLKYGNAYVYINNQGYMLEITSEAGDYPIITNYSTPEEQIKEGNRLCTEDLEKLNDVLRIMEAASINNGAIRDLITKINVEDKSNYILTLEKEKKQVYIGDTSNLSTKMLWLATFLEEEKDNEGIIFMNFDLNTTEPYFREKV